MDMSNDRPDISITLMSGPRDGETLVFEPPPSDDELVLTIGRREGCDIVLGYDSQVSRLHARLIYDARDTDFFLEDADSRNGTFLEQEKVKGRVTLQPGKLFRIGRTWMRLDPLVDMLQTRVDENVDFTPDSSVENSLNNNPETDANSDSDSGSNSGSDSEPPL